MKCPSVSVENAAVTHSDGPPTAQGGTASVACNSGFRHQGQCEQLLLSCQWAVAAQSSLRLRAGSVPRVVHSRHSPLLILFSPVKCAKKDLSVPTELMGAVVVGSSQDNIEVGGKAMVSCPVNYKMKGSEAYTCQLDGSWSPQFDTACENGTNDQQGLDGQELRVSRNFGFEWCAARICCRRA